jgi:hypothetical protein
MWLAVGGLPLARRTQHSTHTKVSQGNGHKAKKADKVDNSERDNSRMGKSAGLRIACSNPAWIAPPEPELGYLGYLVRLERHFCSLLLMFLNCPVVFAWRCSTCHL